MTCAADGQRHFDGDFQHAFFAGKPMTHGGFYLQKTHRHHHHHRHHHLVGGIPTPLKDMSSAVGMIISNIWKVIIQSCYKPPTSHHHHLQRSTSPIFSLWISLRLFHQCLDELWGAGASGSTITRDRYGI